MATRRVNGEAVIDSEFEGNKDWFDRIVIGGVSLVGIASLAAKMGGPTAKAINIALDQQMDTFLEKEAARAEGIPINIVDNATYRNEIIGKDGSTWSATGIPSLEELSAIEEQHYILNESSASILSSIDKQEKRIRTYLHNAETGQPLFKQAKALEGYSYFDPIRSVIDADHKYTLSNSTGTFYVTSLRIEAIRNYMSSKGSGRDNVGDVDFFDPEILDNLNFAKSSDIENIHKNLIQNNKQYAAEYNDVLNKTGKKMKQIIAAKTSTQNDQVPDLMNTRMYVDNVLGTVSDLYGGVFGQNYKLKDKSLQLYSVLPETVMSKKSVKGSLTNGTTHDLIHPDLKNSVDLFKYMGRIKKIATKLEEIADLNNNKVSGIQINVKNFDVAGLKETTRSFFEVRISRNWSKTAGDIVVNIPIKDKHGYLPKMGEVNGTAALNTNWLVGIDKIANMSIDTTELYLDLLYSTLTQSTMNDLLQKDQEHKESLQRKFARKLRSYESLLSLSEGMVRDTYKIDAYRFLHDAEMGMLSKGAKKARLKQIQNGIQSMLNVSKRRKSNKKVVTLHVDLETIQILGESSVNHAASRETTGLWAFGITKKDANGRILGLAELASDHVLREHGIDKMLRNKTLAREMSTNKALQSYADYLVEVFRVDTPGNAGRVQAVEKWAEKIKTRSNDTLRGNNKYNTRPNGFESSHDFANKLVNMLIAECEKIRASGATAMISWANGTSFDGQVIKTLTNGGLEKLNNHATIIDSTNINRNLKLGETGMDGDQLMYSAKRWVLKTGLFTDAEIDFTSSQERLLESLRLISDPRRGLLQGGDIIGSLTKAVGGAENVNLHDSPLTDTFLESIQDQAMMYVHANNQDVFKNALRSSEQLLSLHQHKTFDKTMNDFLALHGLIVDEDRRIYADALSPKQAAKKIFNKTSIAHMSPMYSTNAFSAQNYQVHRHGFHKKNLKSSWHTYMTGLTSPLEQHQMNITYREAGMDKARFANKLNHRVAYVVAGHGMQEGHYGMRKDVFDKTLNHLKGSGFQRSLRLPMDNATLDFSKAGVHQEINDLLKIAERNAKEAIGGEYVEGRMYDSKYLQDAINAELEKRRKANNPIIVDQAVDSTNKFLLGPMKAGIDSKGAFPIKGINIGGNPNDGTVSSFILELAITGSGNQGVTANTGSGKGVLQVYQNDPREVMDAYRKRGFSESSTPEVRTVFNFNKEKYVGSFRTTLLHDLLIELQGVMINSDDVTKVKAAKRRMDEIANELRQATGSMAIVDLKQGSRTMNVDGKNKSIAIYNEGLSWGQAVGGNSDAMMLTKGASGVSFKQLLDDWQYLGSDKIQTVDRLNRYYSFFGGVNGDVSRGRTRINKILDDAMRGGGKSEGLAQMVAGMNLTTTQMRMIIDPMSQVEDYLVKHNYTNKKEANKYMQDNKVIVDKILSTNLKIPALFIAAPNIENPKVDDILLNVIDSVSYSDANFKKVTHAQKTIQWRNLYFNDMLQSDAISESTKTLFKSNMGVKTDSKLASIGRTFIKLRDSFVNNSIANLADTELSLDELSTIFGKTRKIEQIKARLDAMADDNPNRAQLIHDAFAELELLGMNLTENDKDVITQANIKKQKQRLNAILENERWIAADDVHKLSQFAKRNDNLLMVSAGKSYFMPDGTERITEETFKDLKSKGVHVISKQDSFRLNLSKIAEINSMEANPFDFDGLKFLYDMQKEDKLAAESFSPIKNMFNSIVNSSGEEILEMNAIPIPLYALDDSYLNKYGNMEGFGSPTEAYTYTQKVTEFLQSYFNEKNNLDHSGNLVQMGGDVAYNAFQLLSRGFSMNKGSDFNKAVESSMLTGMRRQYNVSDGAQMKARRIVEGTGGDVKQIQKRLKKHFKSIGEKVDSTDIVNMSRQLVSVSSANATTLMLSDKALTDGRFKFQGMNGDFMSFDEMRKSATAKGDLSLELRLDDFKNHGNTLPGMMMRFPVETAGKLSVIQSEILSLNTNLMRFLGMNEEHIHLNSVIGGLIKADNDGDETEIIMQSIDSMKSLNTIEKQFRADRKNMLNDISIRNEMKKYNSEGHIVESVIGKNNGPTTFKVGLMGTDGEIVTEIMSADQYMNTFDDNILKKTIGDLVGDKWAAQNNLHNSAAALESHYATVQLSAMATDYIGIVTNFMRENTDDMHMLNKLVPGIDFTDMTRTMEAGYGAAKQLTIKMQKHNTEAEIFELTEAIKYFEDPALASKDQHLAAKQWWGKQFDDEATKKQQLKLVDMARLGKRFILDHIDEVRPDLGNYTRAVRNVHYGREKANAIDAAVSEYIEKSGRINLGHGLDDNKKLELNQMFGMLQQMYSDDFDLEEFKKANKDKLFKDMIDKSNRSKFSREAVEKALQSKGGKFAAIGAVALLATSFFNPIGKAEDNNFISSELELNRSIPLDQVNASFSKDAFVMMNSDNIKSDENKAKENIVKGMLDNTVFSTQLNMKNYNENIKINKYNSMGYIGPAGNINYARPL